MELLIDQLSKFINGLFASDALPATAKWLTIGVALLFVEFIHRAWMVIWFALGAAAAAAAAYFAPDALLLQIGVFFGVTAVSMAGFVYYRHHEEKSKPETSVLPEGRSVRCAEKIEGAGGIIVVDGVSYKARLESGSGTVEADEWVEIAGFDADELTAIVRRAPTETAATQGGHDE